MIFSSPIRAYAPPAPAVVLRLADYMRQTFPAWVWRPAVAWYELLAIAVLSLWVRVNRAELGMMPRIGFWLAVINPILPLSLAVLVFGARG